MNPQHKLPHCIATLNPKLINSTYPNRNLTRRRRCFQASPCHYKCIDFQSGSQRRKIDLKRYLDLVALGTIADMGSLLGENRILVRYGLRQLRKTKRIGLAKFFTVCELKLGDITPIDIASKVAPRLNSLGRIADPRKGVELLLLRDPIAAETLAKELDLNNIERQKIERRDSEDVETFISKNPQILNHKAIVLSSDKWHPGIIPLLLQASPNNIIAQPSSLPSIKALEKDRSVPSQNFPFFQHLRDNADLLENFGGHDFAAGLTIKEENIQQFQSNDSLELLIKTQRPRCHCQTSSRCKDQF